MCGAPVRRQRTLFRVQVARADAIAGLARWRTAELPDRKCFDGQVTLLPPPDGHESKYSKTSSGRNRTRVPTFMWRGPRRRETH
jgi:hypothetical protein